MALQDLTPQLRTRLSRVERTVGWFVFLAVVLLVFGFGYYIFHTAQRKGWFTPKFEYQTWLNNAAGLKVGDPVKLMGFTAGEISEIIPNAPHDYYGVTIRFKILKPHYGYIWDDSKVKVSSDFLGNRFLEVTKGKWGVPTIFEDTNRTPVRLLRWREVEKARKEVLADTRKAYPGLEQDDGDKFNWIVQDELNRRTAESPQEFYTNLTEIYGIQPEESPALNERLERVANQVESALPNILYLTNKVGAALDHTITLTSNLNDVATNLHHSLDTTLTKVDSVMGTVDTNLPAVFEEVTLTLDNLAAITSNLNAQVQADPTILSNISKAVADTDDLVQGLKRHWFLRSAFKKKSTDKK